MTQAQTCSPYTQTMFYQDFENPTSSTLPETINGGALGYYTSSGYFIGARSRSVNNNSTDMDYGPVNASFATNVKISFSFAPINIDDNPNDYLQVFIYSNGWSNEVAIWNNSKTNDLTYNLSTTVQNSFTYDGNNNPKPVYISNSNKVNKIEISIPDTVDRTNLKIGFLAKNNSNNEFWIIDNIKVTGDFIETKTWNGNNWVSLSNPKKTLPPTSTEKAVIAADFTTQNHGSFTACQCEISNGKTLTISPDTNITIQNNIINNGNIIVQNDGNLLQVNDNATFTGSTIIVNRDTKLKRLEYNLWSSPVSNQNLLAFSPKTLTNRFYVYNETNDFFNIINPTLNNFIPAKGYAIRAPNNFTTANTVFNGVFNGIPNNGVYTVEIYKNGRGYNLTGNPYPSNISFDKFYEVNKSSIEPEIYLWTNTNPNPPIMQGSNYSGDNYAIINKSGGIPAQGQLAKDAPNKTITIGQGFIVKKLNPGTSNLIFNNSMRVYEKGKFTNSRAPIIDEPKVWLQLLTPAKNFNTILIGYVKGATNDVEKGYDSSPHSKTSDMFYSIANNENLVIQGRSNNFNVEDKVQLGAVYYEPGNYEISIAQVEGIFTSAQAIYLKDNKLNKTVNLSEESYQFYSEAGEENNRFEIVYKPDSVLGTDNISKNKETVVYKNAESIIVENNSNKITSVQVFDATGKLVASAKPNSNQFSIENSKFQKGLVIFKISLNGKTETKKFLVK